MTLTPTAQVPGEVAPEQDITPEGVSRQGHKDRELELSKVIVGQKLLMHQVLVCLIAGGNALLGGLCRPGKTVLGARLTDVMDCEFSRIQFTPDLMPADIVGTDILQKRCGRAAISVSERTDFRQPVACRRDKPATPKTQSALLEAMQKVRYRWPVRFTTLPKAFLRAGNAKSAGDGRYISLTGSTA